MCVHICFAMIYTCTMHMITYRSNSHTTTIVCFKPESNLKRLFFNSRQFSAACNNCFTGGK